MFLAVLLLLQLRPARSACECRDNPNANFFCCYTYSCDEVIRQSGGTQTCDNLLARYTCDCAGCDLCGDHPDVSSPSPSPASTPTPSVTPSNTWDLAPSPTPSRSTGAPYVDISVGQYQRNARVPDEVITFTFDSGTFPMTYPNSFEWVPSSCDPRTFTEMESTLTLPYVYTMECAAEPGRTIRVGARTGCCSADCPDSTLPCVHSDFVVESVSNDRTVSCGQGCTNNSRVNHDPVEFLVTADLGSTLVEDEISFSSADCALQTAAVVGQVAFRVVCPARDGRVFHVTAGPTGKRIRLRVTSDITPPVTVVALTTSGTRDGLPEIVADVRFSEEVQSFTAAMITVEFPLLKQTSPIDWATVHDLSAPETTAIDHRNYRVSMLERGTHNGVAVYLVKQSDGAVIRDLAGNVAQAFVPVSAHLLPTCGEFEVYSQGLGRCVPIGHDKCEQGVTFYEPVSDACVTCSSCKWWETRDLACTTLYDTTCELDVAVMVPAIVIICLMAVAFSVLALRAKAERSLTLFDVAVHLCVLFVWLFVLTLRQEGHIQRASWAVIVTAMALNQVLFVCLVAFLSQLSSHQALLLWLPSVVVGGGMIFDLFPSDQPQDQALKRAVVRRAVWVRLLLSIGMLITMCIYTVEEGMSLSALVALSSTTLYIVVVSRSAQAQVTSTDPRRPSGGSRTRGKTGEVMVVGDDQGIGSKKMNKSRVSAHRCDVDAIERGRKHSRRRSRSRSRSNNGRSLSRSRSRNRSRSKDKRDDRDMNKGRGGGNARSGSKKGTQRSRRPSQRSDEEIGRQTSAGTHHAYRSHNGDRSTTVSGGNKPIASAEPSAPTNGGAITDRQEGSGRSGRARSRDRRNHDEQRRKAEVGDRNSANGAQADKNEVRDREPRARRDRSRSKSKARSKSKGPRQEATAQPDDHAGHAKETAYTRADKADSNRKARGRAEEKRLRKERKKKEQAIQSVEMFFNSSVDRGRARINDRS